MKVDTLSTHQYEMHDYGQNNHNTQ